MVADLPKSPCKSIRNTRSPMTGELVFRIADRIAEGIPLKFALALEDEPILLSQWNAFIEKNPRMSRMLDQRCAHWIQSAVREIAGTTLRTMPGKVWILERRFAEHFAVKSTSKVEVSGSVVIGVQEGIRQRAAAYVRGRVEAPKALTEGKRKQIERMRAARKAKEKPVIDVEAQPASSECDTLPVSSGANPSKPGA